MSIRYVRSCSAMALILLFSMTVSHASAQYCANCGPSHGGYVQQSCQGPGCQSLSPCLGKDCHANRIHTEDSQPDVFYNLYVPNNLGAAAGAYPAPYLTPNIVGHTYFTYQPLMPHEFLYHHRRTYYSHYNNGMGLNRTRVRWYGTPLRTALHAIPKYLTKAR